MPEQYLKKFTQAAFEQTAIGKATRKCGALYDMDLEAEGGFRYYSTDNGHPCLAHIVFPAAKGGDVTYYALDGSASSGSGSVHFMLTMGNGFYDEDESRLYDNGTNHDYICLHFQRFRGDPHIYLTRIRPFALEYHGEGAVPDGPGARADEMFASLDLLVQRMGEGYELDFGQMKQDWWNAFADPEHARQYLALAEATREVMGHAQTGKGCRIRRQYDITGQGPSGGRRFRIEDVTIAGAADLQSNGPMLN